MPLPRSFSDSKRNRTPLQPVVEEDHEFDNDNDDNILSMFETRSDRNEMTADRPKSSFKRERLKTAPRSGASPEVPNNHFQVSNVDTVSSKQLDAALAHMKGLNNDVQEILEHLNAQNSIVSRIATGQNEVAALSQGIEQLKDWILSTHNASDGLSESIQSLVASVAKHNEDLGELTCAFKNATKAQKLSSSEQTESLKSLKYAANESKSLLEDMWASYEKDSLLLRNEQEELLAEKEKLSQDRIELEKAAALFEQRKLAAKDNIEYADAMMRKMKETEAKVSNEMEKLVQLSEFVVQKDSEAEEKMAKAQRLLDQLRDWQGVIGNEHDAMLKLKEEVENDRMKLSRDRVTMLKSKTSNVVKPNLPLGRSTRVNLLNDFSSTQPDDLRRRLSTMRAEMKRLSIKL